MSESSAGSPGKKSLAVFAIVDRPGGASSWVRLGSASTNRDGSITLVLDALPIGTNRLQVREPRFGEPTRSAPPAASTAAAEVRP